jgi:hypothetical protein
MSRPELSPHEIDVGLAVHLDPDALEQGGGTYTCPRALRVQGAHTFLCIEAFATRGRWIPLYSMMATNRKILPAGGRRGHAGWVDGTFHYHQGQIWSAPHEAVVDAARAAHDMSLPGQRNTLAKERVPKLSA